MILHCSRSKRAPSIAGSNARRTGYNARCCGVGRMKTSYLKLLILLASFGASGDPFERIQHHVERAAEYVEARNYALARSYLEPVLISPLITGKQRAQGLRHAGLHVHSGEVVRIRRVGLLARAGVRP